MGKHSDPMLPLGSRLKLVPESSKHHACETCHLRNMSSSDASAGTCGERAGAVVVERQFAVAQAVVRAVVSRE